MRFVLTIIPFLAQGSPGTAIVDLIAMAGILIVPATFVVVLVWIKKGRPTSSIAITVLGLVSVLFLIWGIAFFSWLTMPLVEEELAVEEVESAYPILDTSSWSYTAQHPSKDVWIITVKGHTNTGEPIDKIFRASSFSVREQRPDAPSGWHTLKEWSSGQASSELK